MVISQRFKSIKNTVNVLRTLKQEILSALHENNNTIEKNLEVKIAPYRSKNTKPILEKKAKL